MEACDATDEGDSPDDAASEKSSEVDTAGNLRALINDNVDTSDIEGNYRGDEMDAVEKPTVVQHVDGDGGDA
eukprot:2647522-Prorocentrum_lima.AAC.1